MSDTEEAAITTPLGSISTKGKKTSEIITIICLCLLFLLAYVLYEHKNDAKDANAALAGAIKEMTLVQREGVQAQRVMNCLLATDQKDRQASILTCERIAR